MVQVILRIRVLIVDDMGRFHSYSAQLDERLPIVKAIEILITIRFSECLDQLFPQKLVPFRKQLKSFNSDPSIFAFSFLVL